jgi:sporulation protein YlmC with PRC-barrel domain
LINYEQPNEDVGEGVTLVEKGEYRCGGCSNTLAQYRKFSSPEEQKDTIVKQASGDNDDMKSTASYAITSSEARTEVDVAKTTRPIASAQDGFIPIQSLVGMTAYDSEAMFVGKVLEIGLRKSSNGDMDITVKISKQEDTYKNSDTLTEEVLWKNISKIGDIVLLRERLRSKGSQCASCGYQNEEGALFCEECGRKLS